MRISVISTVRNEQASIATLLASLQAQTRQPDEIVIADGGSTDGTVAIIEEHAALGLPVRVVNASGSNISQGRNCAISAASGEIIASTDAGVRLAPCWIEELTTPLLGGDVDVVSGFFVPDTHNIFETAMGATVLPHLADVDPRTFLPSSRSVAFTRTAWHAAGGYPEWLDYCEDLLFDLALRKQGCRFSFAPKAVAHFRPRSSLGAFFTQYYRYARGDGKADLWRKRHAIRYATYLLGPLAFVLAFRYTILWPLLLVAGLAYCWRPWQRLWHATTGWRLIDRLNAFLLVPIIRLVGDLAKMIGYPAGLWWRLHHGPPTAREK